MDGQVRQSCPNEQCPDYGQHGKGNISVRGTYGKVNKRDLLYCRSCGKRFAATHSSALFRLHTSPDSIRQIIHYAAEGVGVRATARILKMDKDTVNRVILRAEAHCAHVIAGLLTSLELSDNQMDLLWTFIKRRKINMTQKNLNNSLNGKTGTS